MTFVFKPYMPFAGAWAADPGGWKTPALTDVLPDREGAVLPPPCPPPQGGRESDVFLPPQGGWSSPNLRFFSAAPGSSGNVAGPAIVRDYFSGFHEQLERAQTPAEALEAWAGLTKNLGWMPATDLESADRRVSEFTKLLERKLRDFQLQGWGLTAHDVFRAVLRYEGFKKSLGKLLEESVRDKKWGKMIANRFKALSDFCRRSPDADWEEGDVEFFHLLRREEGNTTALAGIEAFRQRALRQLAAVDPENLEAVTGAAEILQLFPDEQWEELGDHLARIRLRLEAGEERWDPAWWDPGIAVPSLAEEFVTVECGGQTFTLHFGGSMAEALLNSTFREPAQKRLNDIRTTPENRESVAWGLLGWIEALSKERPRAAENVADFLRAWQEEMFSALLPPPLFEVGPFLQACRRILEEGSYFTVRCGDSFYRLDGVSRQGKLERGREDIARNWTGLRLLDTKKIRKMKKVKCSPDERIYLEGLVKLAPLGEGMHGFLWLLDSESQTIVPPTWRERYFAIVKGAQSGALEPREAALRLIRLAKEEGILDQTSRRHPFLRVEMGEEKGEALNARLEQAGLPFMRAVQFRGVDWNAGTLRLHLDMMERLFLRGSTPLRVLAGDLLETGRKESPWDDRYTPEELGRLLSAWGQTVEMIREAQNPVAVFKREAGRGSKDPFGEISLPWGGLLCDPKLGTKLDIPAFIRKQWPDVDLRPENFRKLGKGRAQTIFAIAAWREVLMHALESFSNFARGEPYDEELLDLLVAIAEVEEKGILKSREMVRDSGNRRSMVSIWKKGIQQRMRGLIETARVDDFRFPIEMLMKTEPWTPEELRSLVYFFTLQRFLMGSRFGTWVPRLDITDPKEMATFLLS